MIIPTKGGYEAIIGAERFTLETEDIILIHSGVIHSLKAPSMEETVVFGKIPFMRHLLEIYVELGTN